MSFRLKTKKRIIAVLLTMLPAFVVGSLVIGANVYFDLDSGTVRTFENSAITGNFSVTGETTLISSSTTDLNKAVNISQTGATVGTDYGLYVANTGAATTNIAGYFSASGATTANYGLIVESGNVGIGDTSPAALLTVGASDAFQVNSSGAITAGGNLTFSGATPAISASTAATNISLNAGTTGTVDIAGNSTGNVNLAGGSGATGCTIDNSTGALTCAGNITGPTAGTVGYWARSGTTLSQATANDALDLGSGTITTTGTITSGLINSQTISSAANFTGTVTAVTSFLAPTIDTATGVALNIGTATQTALTLGRAGAATTINGSGLTVGPTAWTATPTISGLVTMTAGFDSNAASTAAGLTVDGNGDLIISSGTGAFSMAGYTGTGNAASITSSSTTDLNKALNISQTGATTGTDYGLYAANTGAGTTNIAGYFSASGATTANYGLIVAGGSVGIGTTAPASLLGLKGTLSSALTGTVSVTIGTAAVTGVGTLFTTELATGDSIKIGSEIFTVASIASNTSLTLDSNHTAGASGVTAYRDPVLFNVDNGDAVNKFTITRSGNVGIGTATPSSKLTLSASGDFAIGDYNAVLIDDMEAITDWTAFDGTNTPVALESANVRKGSGAMKITTTVSQSLNDTIKKTLSSAQDWSGYERIGFWIRASETGQIISAQFSEDDVTYDDHNITISEANQWQYEEWNLSEVAAANLNAVLYFQFKIDDQSTANTFYIDQVRVYDYDERTSELFVDNDGNLVVWGRGGIELGRGVPGASLAGMKIGSANVEINQPLNVNVAGDTGMAYDLQFLNTGGANITSQGALTISAGDPNKTQNLTLTTQANQMSGDSGVATGGSTTTLVDSSKSWTASEWIGGTIYIISGTGAGQERTITANDGTSVTVAAWTTPDTTSSYRLAYQQGGDVIVDVANSSNNTGGFKVAGMDNGSYVFRVGPDGNVEIGGNGAAGSNLVVKQNLTLTGGNITVSKLAISQAGTPSGTAATTGGSMATATYYYAVTALNNNGETTKSTESAGIAVTGPTGSVVLSWTSVSGAIGYKIYRTTSSGTYTTPALITFVSSPVTTYTDIAASASAGAPPTANTTGGKIAINTSNPARNLEVLENTSATAQMKLISDGSNYGEFYVDSTGDLSIDTTGTGGDDIRILDQNLRVCAGGSIGSDSCPSVALSAKGNLVVENKIYTNGDNENMPRHSCPTGWVLVPGSATFGTEDFCVMKYEAKQNSSTKNPESVAAGTPWVNVSQYEAKNACQRIGAHLINEAEWMTIARNAEAVAGNWTLGSVGSGYLFAGHDDNAPAAAKAASATDTGDYRCAYTDTAGTTENPTPCPTNTAAGASGTAGNQARVLTLSNGNILWDIAGNVWEWTDALCEATSWYNSAAWIEWNNANLTDYERIIGGSTSYTSANGVGQYYGCSANGNAFRRGGAWNNGAVAGAFTLVLNVVPSVTGTDLGFRCSR